MSDEYISFVVQFQEYVQKLSPIQFEEFCYRYLIQLPEFSEVHRYEGAMDRGFDITAVRRSNPVKQVAFEVKATKMLTALSLRAIQQIQTQFPDWELIILASGQMTRAARQAQLEVQAEVWDAVVLADKCPEAIRLEILRESELRRLRPFDPLFPDLLFSERSGRASESTERSKVESLKLTLNGLGCGNKDALRFQKWCRDALEYLFRPPLSEPEYEHSDRDGRNRRDIIFPNHATDGFWRVVSLDYRAPFIVVDAKNSCKKIGKDDVLSTANYLKPYGTGMFGFIISRHGPSDAGHHAIREHWIGAGKMIVSLTTSEIIEMLDLKLTGAPPEEVIARSLTAFRLSV